MGISLIEIVEIFVAVISCCLCHICCHQNYFSNCQSAFFPNYLRSHIKSFPTLNRQCSALDAD